MTVESQDAYDAWMLDMQATSGGGGGGGGFE